MKRVGIALAALFLAYGAHGSESLYYPCQTCHGIDGEGNESLDAPAIAGMDAVYLAGQLRYFRDGVRGVPLDDIPGRQMSLIMAILEQDEDIADLAQYVAAMPRVRPLKTLPPPDAGAEELYTPCAACHGAVGEGVDAVAGPAIAWLDDWYVERQLVNFQRGVRGSHPRDVGGMQMRAFAASLSADDIQQLASYVATLSGQPATRSFSNEDGT